MRIKNRYLTFILLVYLILDTNIWIYMANGLDTATGSQQGNNHFGLLKTLKEHVDSHEIRILSNSIIVEEWQRNKGHAYQRINILREKYQHAFIEFKRNVRAAPAGNHAENIAVRNELSLLITENELHVAAVESFLLQDCIQTPIDDKLKTLVFDLAISKKAPFHNKKNNTADAAILLSAAEYLKEDLKYEEISAIFVPNNVTDFADSNNKERFHPELLKILPTDGIKYQNYLPAALHISQSIIAEMKEFYQRESTRFACESIVCSGREDFERFGFLDQSSIYKYESDKLGENQLDLFTNKLCELQDRGAVKNGRCEFCGTLHYECPQCGELECAEKEDLFQCPHCKSEFSFRRKKEEDRGTFIYLNLPENREAEEED